MAVIVWDKRKGVVNTTKGNIQLTITKPKGMISYKLKMGDKVILKSLSCPDDLKEWAEEYFDNMV